jgi:hypothetical protein
MTDNGFIYAIRSGKSNLIKIGFSVEPQSRLKELQIGSPSKLELLQTWPGTRSDEKRIHLFLKKNRVHGEWFQVDYDEAAYVIHTVTTYDPADDVDVCLEQLQEAYSRAVRAVIKAGGSRKCFALATELVHVPFVLYEIWDLAKRGRHLEIVPLIKSVIEVTQRQADSLAHLPRVAGGEVAE